MTKTDAISATANSLRDQIPNPPRFLDEQERLEKVVPTNLGPGYDQLTALRLSKMYPKTIAKLARQ